MNAPKIVNLHGVLEPLACPRLHVSVVIIVHVALRPPVRTHQDRQPAGFKHPARFGEKIVGIGDMLDHGLGKDNVETVGFERERLTLEVTFTNLELVECLVVVLDFVEPEYVEAPSCECDKMVAGARIELAISRL